MSNHDPLDIHSQARSKEKRDTRDRLARETEEGDIKWLMGSRRGRRIVWRLLEQAGVFRASFNTKAMAMAFAEGNKNGGLRLLSQIHALCPELYPTMVREANEQRDIDDGNRANTN